MYSRIFVYEKNFVLRFQGIKYTYVWYSYLEDGDERFTLLANYFNYSGLRPNSKRYHKHKFREYSKSNAMRFKTLLP